MSYAVVRSYGETERERERETEFVWSLRTVGLCPTFLRLISEYQTLTLLILLSRSLSNTYKPIHHTSKGWGKKMVNRIQGTNIWLRIIFKNLHYYTVSFTRGLTNFETCYNYTLLAEKYSYLFHRVYHFQLGVVQCNIIKTIRIILMKPKNTVIHTR